MVTKILQIAIIGLDKVAHLFSWIIMKPDLKQIKTLLIQSANLTHNIIHQFLNFNASVGKPKRNLSGRTLSKLAKRRW